MCRRTQSAASHRRSRSRTGTTALELVCVLPVLMAIVLGAADLGRFAQYDNIVSNSARLAAEYGATHRRTALNGTAWEHRIHEVALAELAHLPDFDENGVTIDVDVLQAGDAPLQIEVTVNYPFEMIIDWPGLPAQFEVRAAVAYEEYR